MKVETKKFYQPIMDFECGKNKATVYIQGYFFDTKEAVKDLENPITIDSYDELFENAVHAQFNLYIEKSFWGKEYIVTPIGNITRDNFEQIKIQNHFKELNVTVAEARKRLTPIEFRAYMQNAYDENEIVEALKIEEEIEIE